MLDRAYGDFAFDEFPAAHDRLVVFSTFSKAWGLAGLRIGWVTSASDNIREIRKVKLPYNLNFVSEEIALIALENVAVKDAHVRELVSERTRLVREMEAIESVRTYPTEANFIAFETKLEPKQLFEKLYADGILIRNVSTYPGMARALRVSVGSTQQNDKFVTSLKGALVASS